LVGSRTGGPPFATCVDAGTLVPAGGPARLFQGRHDRLRWQGPGAGRRPASNQARTTPIHRSLPRSKSTPSWPTPSCPSRPVATPPSSIPFHPTRSPLPCASQWRSPLAPPCTLSTASHAALRYSPRRPRRRIENDALLYALPHTGRALQCRGKPPGRGVTPGRLRIPMTHEFVLVALRW